MIPAHALPGPDPTVPGSAPPLAIVDLASVEVDGGPGGLPSCPVIGIGDPAHPLADTLDAVVERPIGLEALRERIVAAPRAAAALAQLLRATAGIDPHAALVAESLCYGMLQASAEHRAWLAGRTPASLSPAGTVDVARHDDTLEIVLNRPAARNAIDVTLRDALHEAFTLAALDRDIVRVRMRGRGRCFSVGAELGEFGTTRDPATAHAIRMATLPALPLLACADRLEVHVHGACIGAGLEMAAFARRVTAAPDAWFQLPELAMGVIPGAGGTVSIPRRIGRQRAALLMLSGRRIDARTALRWGLIDAIVETPPGDEDGADSVG